MRRIPSFLLTLPRGAHVAKGCARPMLERAIGVIYLPESELASHYFHARLSDQFDAVIHFDQTRAVEPLERARNGSAANRRKHFLPACRLDVPREQIRRLAL